MIRTLTILLLSLTIIACQTNNQDELKEDNIVIDQEYLTVPFDTTQIIANLEIVDSINRQDLIEQDNKKGLRDNLDTLELMYIAYACDCQNWVDPIECNRVQDHNYGNRDDPGDDYIEFDLNKYGYYIEPADKELNILLNTYVSGNIVKFIGREYNDIGYPENADFMGLNPPKGKVFRYYSYEIQKPYRVWGPRTFEGIDQETGDTLTAPNTLTIKE